MENWKIAGLYHCQFGGLKDWRIRSIGECRIRGLKDLRIGGLENWRIKLELWISSEYRKQQGRIEFGVEVNLEWWGKGDGRGEGYIFIYSIYSIVLYWTHSSVTVWKITSILNREHTHLHSWRGIVFIYSFITPSSFILPSILAFILLSFFYIHILPSFHPSLPLSVFIHRYV